MMVVVILSLGWASCLGAIGVGVARSVWDVHDAVAKRHNYNIKDELYASGVVLCGHLVIAALLLRGSYLIVGM